MIPLEALIRTEIRERGPVRFDRFMELALYHPVDGYYRNRAIGRQGDFYTSVSVGPLFGRLLGAQLVQMGQRLGEEVWLMEQGAHDGQLAVDILTWCRAEAPSFFRTIHYAIVEPDATTRATQQARLNEAGLLEKIRWFETLAELAREQPVGIFLSNELVDALPLRLVRREVKKWHERWVTASAEGPLAWLDRPVDDAELLTAVEGLPEIEGYTTEINLSARCWMKGVGQALRRGYVLTIDYGFPASVYYAPFRTQGTLTTYRHHRRGHAVLEAPGTQDITAHVDFTALARAGKESGLTVLGLVDQSRFFMGIAHDELSSQSRNLGLAQQTRAWTTLTHPEYLGGRFQVLVQAKDAPGGLDGLRYARPGGLD